MRPRGLLRAVCGFGLLGLMVACNGLPSPPGPLVSPSSTASPASSERVVTAVDPRLMPALLTIAQHPEWAPGPATDLNAHRALPELDDLCVEVLRPGLLPLYVTVDVGSLPWTVGSIVTFDPATDREPQITFEGDDPSREGDLCRGVLRGDREPFPEDPASLEINGPLGDAAHRQLIAGALLHDPEAFGIDRSSRPAINVVPMPSGVQDRACYEGVVYQGGPRAVVRITLLREAGAWRLHHVRVTRQALHEPEPIPEGAC